MKILATIAEYNPFHEGHIFHLEESKKFTGSSHTMAIMSGNFVQRGEPAIINKWERAKIAGDQGGINLILELPFYYSSASAGFFAKGAMNILKTLNTEIQFSFGSESGTVTELQRASKLLNKNDLNIKEDLKEGLSFIKAREKFLMNHGIEEDLLRGSNNILGIEYLKHINNKIKPITIKINKKYLSASKHREKILKNKNIFDQYEKAIFYEISRLGKIQLNEIFEVSEGIENLIYEKARISKDLKELITFCTSKRYPSSRIKRILNNIFINYTKSDAEKMKIYKQKYARVLFADKKGKELLSFFKETSDIKFLTKIKRDAEIKTDGMFNLDIRVNDLYNQFFYNFSEEKISELSLNFTNASESL